MIACFIEYPFKWSNFYIKHHTINSNKILLSSYINFIFFILRCDWLPWMYHKDNKRKQIKRHKIDDSWLMSKWLRLETERYKKPFIEEFLGEKNVKNWTCNVSLYQRVFLIKPGTLSDKNISTASISIKWN